MPFTLDGMVHRDGKSGIDKAAVLAVPSHGSVKTFDCEARDKAIMPNWLTLISNDPGPNLL